MGNHDCAPDEEVRYTGQREQPSEELATGIWRLIDEREEAERHLNDDAPEWATRLVNVREEFRCHASRCESLHGTRAAEAAGVGDGKDGNGDDTVEEGGKDLDIGLRDGQNESRGLGVGAGGMEKAGCDNSKLEWQQVFAGRMLTVGVWDQKAHDKQRNDVEQENAPQHLLCGTRNALDGVCSLRGGKTSQLGTTVRKGGSGEHIAEACEAVGECTRVIPV